MDLLGVGDFGGCAVAIYPRESELSSSIIFFLSLPLSPPTHPSTIHFPLPI